MASLESSLDGVAVDGDRGEGSREEEVWREVKTRGAPPTSGRQRHRETNPSLSARKTPETSPAKSAGRARARARHVPPHSTLFPTSRPPHQAPSHSREHTSSRASALRSVRFLISSPVSLPPPPATPPSTDRSRAHGRTDGLAAHGRRPPPPRLLLHLQLQKLQTVPAAPAPATAAAVRRSSADGARGGGGTPAAGGPPAPGRAGGGRRAGHPRGDHRRAAAPGHHGRPLRLHALGGLPRLAVAPRAHRPGRDRRAQEAAQAGRRRRRRRGRGLRSPASARRQVPHRDQDRRAHRGEEEAGEGVVQGQALQRGVDPAGAGRHGVRGRRAQHLAAHGEALPGPAPLRRRGHHRALGGGRGAGARDAEGERDGQEPAHRAQHHQRPALHLANPHGARHRPQGLRVHQMAMSVHELRLGWLLVPQGCLLGVSLSCS